MTREKRRRALTQVGGEVETAGHPALAAILARALENVDEDIASELTHPFHAYPARMHPGIARVVLAELAGRDSRVLDPFCGSGTVLLEARLRGLRTMGSDLNPVALELSRVKCAKVSPRDRDRFLLRLEGIAQASEARVRGRVPARAPLTRDLAVLFEGHVLLELAGLREEILKVEAETARRALLVLLSSILVKFSKQRADTDATEAPKRIRKGIPTEFFLRKGKELVERWAALDAALPRLSKEPQLELVDARNLGALFSDRKYDKIDLVLTSPPYGGTYDYYDHHALRCAFLELDDARLRQNEIGARRRISTTEMGAGRWDRELASTLTALASVVHPEGFIVLLLGDGRAANRDLPADAQIEKLAPKAGLTVLARASQRRLDWQGGKPRKEHLIALALV